MEADERKAWKRKVESMVRKLNKKLIGKGLDESIDIVSAAEFRQLGWEELRWDSAIGGVIGQPSRVMVLRAPVFRFDTWECDDLILVLWSEVRVLPHGVVELKYEVVVRDETPIPGIDD